jgi:hypothetical protein
MLTLHGVACDAQAQAETAVTRPRAVKPSERREDPLQILLINPPP